MSHLKLVHKLENTNPVFNTKTTAYIFALDLIIMMSAVGLMPFLLYAWNNR